ncbi:MAG: carboxylating nicotinate-nucleotide diphosphorylase [Clostridia bacterium]|nr:carboxylating nicotinate-nucleotide diphosphorylase [Clostridia bacterium]
MFFSEDVTRLLRDALREDIGTGDITTLSVIDSDRQGYGRYIAKEDGVLCGMDVVEAVFRMLDPSVVLTRHMEDGASFARGDVLAEVRGNAVSILSGERVGLNLLQHLSGVATRTREAVDTVAGTSAQIVDTRKTTPGMRVLEKYAVRVGGGSNHRFNLADGVLIKDNHIVAAGSITEAVRAAKRRAPHTLKVEVETETMEQVDEAIAAGADIIMLDNMDNETMRAAVERVAGRALTEASGNMGERDLRSVAETGVDLISIGALTHSVRALDISLKFVVE